MYHLFKQSRAYFGEPYCGYTSGNIPAEYDTLKEARHAVKEFHQFNPVGWNIWDSKTGELVEGVDFSKGY